MHYGVCHLSVVPCRSNPSDKSEMVTQLLFGDYVEILDTKESWTLIRILDDHYECWVDSKQIAPVDEKEVKDYNSSTKHFSLDLVQLVENLESNSVQPIVLGSALPFYKNGDFQINGEQYKFEGTIHSAKTSVVDLAMYYLDAPYLWGGKSPFGIDCSGFTQMVFKFSGKNIPRDAFQQAEPGDLIPLIEEAKPASATHFLPPPIPNASPEFFFQPFTSSPSPS